MKRKTWTVWIELDPENANKDITIFTGTKTACHWLYKKQKNFWQAQGYPLHVGYIAQRQEG